MKKSIFSWGMLVAVCLFVTTGCQKQNDAAAESNNFEKESIAAIIQNPNTSFTIKSSSSLIAARGSAGRQVKFTYLAVALARTGLTSTLSTLNSNYTLFAPTDEAFQALGFKTIQDVVKAPKEVLTPILLYHVVAAKVMAAQVPAGPNAAVKTVNGADVFLTSNSNGVFINGSPVIVADVKAANGVIHVIDNVLLPPAGNIVATAIANPDFSFLVAAVLRASQGTTNVAALLSGDGPLTVFAPTNDAFKKAGFNTLTDIGNAQPDDLTPILAYHVVPGRVFSSDLTDNMSVNMFAGGSTTITLTGGPKIKGTKNAEAFNIIKTNIVTTNGVIHVIDGVLLP
ncbi:putative surface protein with fasciclin (FAS1) repeats [Lacibacter cauensis]|uniref:Putative surface protein with fasciclin (FAS1) repeats n=1 Tax=Lacibacter cauensis TaxID=510947 RepID=A0A562SK41_9BACT|nr:fasciclin domain-containing protein [Lacibacter cauensis]TWI81206.1 putative surface protein with fasciclin (FAS1) repeats [Lacibacter cauensis]